MKLSRIKLRLATWIVTTFVLCGGFVASASAGGVALTGDILCNGSTNAYEPAAVTVTAGSSVSWGCVFGSHPLVSDDGLWSTQSSGTAFSHTFPTAGSFKFHCDIHGGSGMKGTINVTAPEPTTSPTITKNSIKTNTVKSLLKAKAFKMCLASDRPVKRTIDVFAMGKGGKSLFHIKKTDANFVDTATAGCAIEVRLKQKILRRLRKFKGKQVNYTSTLTVTDASGKSASLAIDATAPSK